MKDFLEVVKNRKSIRSFKTERVDPEIIKKIIAVGTFAPTNCNQQLWNFILVDRDDVKERLVQEAASNTLILRAPALIVVTYDGWNYKEAIQGASLAVSHLLLAAAYYGVGALPMNSYGSDAQVRRVLHIPQTETICCFVVLGYPDERALTAHGVPRRSVEEVVHFNMFSGKKKERYEYDPDTWTAEELRAHQKYYCRKTFLGKEMDIMSHEERFLVRKALSGRTGRLVDFFSYDGAYVREFPDIDVTYVDFTSETSEYTKTAVSLSAPGQRAPKSYAVWDDTHSYLSGAYRTASLIFKLERLPQSVREKIFHDAYRHLAPGGEFLIIARKTNLFLCSFFVAIRLLFGNELRKTGIYAFFGPYKPISVRKIKTLAKKSGFASVSVTGFFFFPTFYEQAYQMFLQYLKSGGSSYLHRTKRVTLISRCIEKLVAFQGFRKVGPLGSVAVIVCRK